MDATKYGGSYTDYTMIQPALVVLRKDGTVQQTWSWNTAPLDRVHPKTEMTPVRVGGIHGEILVGVRPMSADLGPSILEDRDVKLAGKPKLTLMIEMIGLPKLICGGAVAAAVVGVGVGYLRSLL
eukprot:TRINITY_DN9443_c0_g1_i1.p1 TRINITY_DN9443_c0_g1~~TRINITY_DN9443_c0_g1_i1.p1  ORF type:complete len:125 (-),score=23.56 TRINITY_DN9443_c0_g1_i1:432-806(-)